MRHPARRRAEGFTLIELAIVLLILGLLVSFILVASYEGVQRAEIRATQALIAKLEVGVADRIETLLSTRITPNGAHRYLAAVYPSGSGPGTLLPWGLQSEGRAHVIARLDQIKRELPDTFFVQVAPATLPAVYDPTGTQYYPINFAARPYPLTPSTLSPANFVLPLGNSVGPGYNPVSHPPPYTTAELDPDGDGRPNVGPGAGVFDTGEGIYGASYAAAGGLYKNLGYAVSGYDGVDNNNNTLVDEWSEGIFGLTPTQIAEIKTRLSNHLAAPHTARSEMLYAVLVEGRGPLGSIFNRDDFTEREVRDTDNDGLPEFTDAWGEPLYFYRWPVHHTSDLQKGGRPYDNGTPTLTDDATETRQQNPLDPSAQLVAPAWWWSMANAGAGAGTGPTLGGMSNSAWAITSYFHPIVDYNGFPTPPSGAGYLWDRSGFLPRRAYFSKFLIASGGPDRKLGIGQLTRDYTSGNYDASGAIPTPVPLTDPNYPAYVLWIENSAAPLPSQRSPNAPFFTADQNDPAISNLTTFLQEWAADDLTNQNLNSPGGQLP